MRINNPQTGKTLEQGLLDVLTIIRAKRDFNPQLYIKNKSMLLNRYMSDFKLKSCVVAVSGGVDSAVVLGIVHNASRHKNSPIKNIYAILMPVFSPLAATNQKGASKRGEEIAKYFNSKKIVVDLTKSHTVLKNTIDKSINLKGKNWAAGQLAAYIKTPTLYYITSLLNQANSPAVVCGTTNRDEGAYLGYFGKASDGMVDLQIISDIHKSEVCRVAKILNIPEEIINIKPSGDMFDGRTDEEVFGTTYEFVELYITYLTFTRKEKIEFSKKLNAKSKKQFEKLSKRLEKIHQYNRHKYLGKSPSVHFDIYKRFVPGGWEN